MVGVSNLSMISDAVLLFLYVDVELGTVLFPPLLGRSEMTI